MIPHRLDFRLLKRAVSIEQVLAHRGLLDDLRVRPHQIVGPCPVHRGDNPRAFVVSRSRNLWRCFTGCAGGGDVVELVRRLDRGGYYEAAEYLASLAGKHTPRVSVARAQTQAAKPFRPFRDRLPLDHETPMLQRKGIRPEVARLFQVGAYRGRGMLQGCVAVRLHDPQGRPLGYAGRRIDPRAVQQRGKWVFPPRLPKNDLLYGFHHVRWPTPRFLVLVECPWGVLRLAQLGIPAVGLLGTHLSETQRSLLCKASNVIVMMDGDPAGRRAATRIRHALRNDVDTAVINLLDGLDPDDLTDSEISRVVGRDLPF
ncbi:toprim domain-containing protein [bacterium]|nr:toprim domain-containing protein [bacterium]